MNVRTLLDNRTPSHVTRGQLEMMLIALTGLVAGIERLTAEGKAGDVSVLVAYRQGRKVLEGIEDAATIHDCETRNQPVPQRLLPMRPRSSARTCEEYLTELRTSAMRDGVPLPVTNLQAGYDREYQWLRGVPVGAWLVTSSVASGGRYVWAGEAHCEHCACVIGITHLPELRAVRERQLARERPA